MKEKCNLFGEAGERKIINSELWHACAGPLVSLPPVGSLVVYFPQGHSEQVRRLSHLSQDECYLVVVHLKVFLIGIVRWQPRCIRRSIAFQVTPHSHLS